MNVTRIAAIVGAIAVGGLLQAGCGSNSQDATATSTAATAPSTTPPRTPTPVSRATTSPTTTAPTTNAKSFPCSYTILDYNASNFLSLAGGSRATGASGPLGPYTAEQLSEFRTIVQNNCPYSLTVFDAAVLQIPINAQRAAEGSSRLSEAAVASASADALSAEGKFAREGSHLVGTDIQPGTWQSVEDRVTDCYWETSDASGNIIDNNFISVAPQFTIEIPSDAAGFTNRGCTFQLIG